MHSSILAHAASTVAALERRAVWLQKTRLEVLRSLGIRNCVEGRPPRDGLVVPNHLSYLDIVILSAAMPCFFVAKVEMNRWPFFGRAARSGGTLFIDRSSRDSAESVAALIGERLRLSIPVAPFSGRHKYRRHVSASLSLPPFRAGDCGQSADYRGVCRLCRTGWNAGERNLLV